MRAITVGRAWTAAVAAVTLTLVGFPGHAQDAKFPNRPISLSVPFAPGGGVDIVARILSAGMSTQLGQPVVVENRPGGSGSIAARYVARAEPDGYSLLLGNTNTFVVNHILLEEAQPDLPPIGIIGKFSYILVVAPSSPATTLEGFLKLARDQGGKLNYGSPGVGSPHHLAMEMLKHQAGIGITHIAYKGAAPAITDLMAGHIQAMFIDYPAGIAFIRSGKLRAIALGDKTRSPLLPDLPTLAEQGLRDFEVTGWLGIAAPKGLPAPVTKQIGDVLVKTLDDPEVRKRFLDVGLEPSPPQSAEQMAQFLNGQRATWSNVIKTQGIRSN